MEIQTIVPAPISLFTANMPLMDAAPSRILIKPGVSIFWCMLNPISLSVMVNFISFLQSVAQ